jgi:hypothetical protein
MTGRIVKYSTPVPFHKAMPGSKSVVIMKRIDDDGDGFTPAKPRKPKPKSRFAGYAGVDEDGFIPNLKRENNMTNEIDRGPFAKMLDRQALALQAQIGGSYEQAYVKVYTDPSNRTIVDNARLNHLEKSHDAMFGTKLSPIPVQKAAPPDPKQDFVQRAVEDRGPAHTRLHEMALEHSRAHGLSYQQSYTRLFTSPENVALRAGIAAEAGIRTLSLDEARALAPSKPFPAYSAPGHRGDPSNEGRSGAKPSGYGGG